MANEISIVLSGIGGYGNLYVSALLEGAEEHGCRLVGAADPAPERCRRLAELQERRVPFYPSLEAFYAAKGADLAVIAAPIPLHASQTCLALGKGSHVLCEKPLAATVEQARTMFQARRQAGKQVAIGYQWSFSPPIQALKQDVMAGRFGRPRRLKTLVLWPRDEKYYNRSRWAGRKRDDQGNWALDSPVNNAAAHYLHNMFYVLGRQVDRSAWPDEVVAELYRAHPIENYDTAVLHCRTTEGAEILFVTSHATKNSRGPVFCFEFEEATVRYGNGAPGGIVAHFRDGSTHSYGNPNDSPPERKLWETIQAIRNGTPVLCGLEAAAAHTACMYAAQHSVPAITPFPPDLIHVEGEPGTRKTWVDGLDTVLERCYEEFRFPSEVGAPWAQPGRNIPAVPAEELMA